MNLVFLRGNASRDGEKKHLPSGGSFYKFSIATNESWKNKAGEWQKRATFHNCTLWGKAAENITVRKGDSVFVEGKISTNTIEREGKKETFFSINCNEVIVSPKNGERADIFQEARASVEKTFTTEDVPFDDPKQADVGKYFDQEEIPF